MKLSTLTVICSLLATSSCVTESNFTAPPSSQELLPSDFKPPQVFQNVNLVRNINLDKGYVRETINVVIENTSKEPQSEYYLPVADKDLPNLGGFEVRDKKETGKGPFDVHTLALGPVLGDHGTAAK
jgi:oligosaccharyltransferase complex subunit alpha (ribophorin I)